VDSRQIFLVLCLALAVPGSFAQPRFAVEPRSEPPVQSGQGQRSFGVQSRGSTVAERCANYERQLGDVLLLEQQPNSTGRADQLATRREQLLLAKQKAGC